MPHSRLAFGLNGFGNLGQPGFGLTRSKGGEVSPVGFWLLLLGLWNDNGVWNDASQWAD